MFLLCLACSLAPLPLSLDTPQVIAYCENKFECRRTMLLGVCRVAPRHAGGGHCGSDEVINGASIMRQPPSEFACLTNSSVDVLGWTVRSRVTTAGPCFLESMRCMSSGGGLWHSHTHIANHAEVAGLVVQ